MFEANNSSLWVFQTGTTSLLPANLSPFFLPPLSCFFVHVDMEPWMYSTSTHCLCVCVCLTFYYSTKISHTFFFLSRVWGDRDAVPKDVFLLINVSHLCLRERGCYVDHLGPSDRLSILPGNDHGVDTECLTSVDTFDPSLSERLLCFTCCSLWPSWLHYIKDHQGAKTC